MASDEELREEYRSALNPGASVPTRIVTNTNGRKLLSASLLPFWSTLKSDSGSLPAVTSCQRTGAAGLDIITKDVQPPVDSRVAQRVKEIRGELDEVVFVKGVFQDGLGAYEALFMGTRETRTAGFTVGSRVTMVDACLIPAVDQACFYRFGLEFAPNVMEIYDTQKQTGAFQAADWRNQPDAPEKYRHKSA
ncbi:hypothetical protein J3458_021051 [Metarhizium acridum]|uniref:uncharacterized protein n=1 Tax=Metarhizium acridum TaxID=92637 RepID=UPI001C6B32CE|nr:hypothetical protein J3458_021051 [Metarhizium acridum]